MTEEHLPLLPFLDRYQMTTSVCKQDLIHCGDWHGLSNRGKKGKERKATKEPGNIKSSHCALHTVQMPVQTTLATACCLSNSSFYLSTIRKEGDCGYSETVDSTWPYSDLGNKFSGNT